MKTTLNNSEKFMYNSYKKYIFLYSSKPKKKKKRKKEKKKKKMVDLSIFWLEFSSRFGEKEAHVRRIFYSRLIYWTFTYMGCHFQTDYRFLVNGQWF